MIIPARELKMWLAIRTDIDLSRGKLATQAGHAYMGISNSLHWGNERNLEYQLSGSPKISVVADNGHALARIVEECMAAGIPHYAVCDAGRTEIPAGTMTVVAFGPWYRDELPKYLQRLQLMKDKED